MASVAAVAGSTDCVLRGGGSKGMSVAAASSQCGIALASPFQRNGSPKNMVIGRNQSMRSTSLRPRSLVRAAKLPAGVEAPVEEPKLPVSLWGFTEKAEFANKGILQMIGVEVGKGLNIPL